MKITINKKEYELQTLDTQAQELSKKRWDSIAKPLHSLGKMEKLVIQIAGITGSADVSVKKRALVPMCADNGVVEEGVTQTGQPGPEISSTPFGSSFRIPKRNISCVWVPQTSMIRRGRPRYSAMISAEVFMTASP